MDRYVDVERFVKLSKFGSLKELKILTGYFDRTEFQVIGKISIKILKKDPPL